MSSLSPRRIHGYFFGSTSRPLVSAVVRFPRLDAEVVVEFLIDTGADRTFIHWADRANLLGPDGHMLPSSTTFTSKTMAYGIGGTGVEYGVERATMVFMVGDDPNGIDEVSYELDVGIQLRALPPPTDGHSLEDDMPSVLGRDVLKRLTLICDMPGDRVELVEP